MILKVDYSLKQTRRAHTLACLGLTETLEIKYNGQIYRSEYIDEHKKVDYITRQTPISIDKGYWIMKNESTNGYNIVFYEPYVIWHCFILAKEEVKGIYPLPH